MNNTINADNIFVISKDQVEENNKRIMQREILFSILPDTEPVNFTFPEFKYNADIREDLSFYEEEFDICMLNDINFYVNCIENGLYKVQNKLFNGDILLFLLSKPLSFLEQILTKLG